MKILGFGKSKSTQERAWDKCKKLERKKDVKRLIKYINHKEHFYRIEAISGLGSLKDKRAINPLVEKIFNDKDMERLEKVYAAEALHKIGDSARDQLLRVLHHFFELGTNYFQGEALSILNSVRNEVGEVEDSFLNVLANVLENNSKKENRELAANCIGYIKNPNIIEPLRKALKDEHYSVREEAVYSLSKFLPSSLEALNEAMYDDSETRSFDRKQIYPFDQKLVRTIAASFLINVGEPAKDYLVAALDHTDQRMRDIVLYGLKKINFTPINKFEKIDYFFAIFSSDPESFKDTKEFDELIKMGELVIKTLFNKMSHYDRNIARIAAESLKTLSWFPSSMSEKVIYLIAKGDLENLSSIGEAATDDLLIALDHKNDSVRQTAAQVLGKMKNREVIEPLLKYKFERITRDDNAINEAIRETLFGDYTGIIKKVCTWDESEAYYMGDPAKYSKYALKDLCNMKSQISNNILHMIADIKDEKCDAPGRDAMLGLCYSDHIEKAKLELQNRGNPSYDPSVFLSEKDWIIQPISSK